MKVLFIVKKQRIGYGGGGVSSGLYNSAKFVVDMLQTILDVHAKVVLVTDNNDIDRVVTEFRPRIVIIEALWVEPAKFHVLTKLHPHVRWVIRNHSAMPFLAHEGVAMDWFFRYIRMHHVHFGCNDSRTQYELTMLANASGLDDVRIPLLPNYYPPTFHPREHYSPDTGNRRLHIACFGAIRPLKNQLIQAVAGIHFAERADRHLHFHVNTERVECEGEPILRNLRQLFHHLPRHSLVEHRWLHRAEFIQLVRAMDLGLQCAYSETFNIVTADFVMNDVPVVVSSEISFVSQSYMADPNNSNDITFKIGQALQHPTDHHSVHLLRRHDLLAVREWQDFLDCYAG